MITHKEFSNEIASASFDYGHRDQRQAREFSPCHDAGTPTRYEGARCTSINGWLSSEERQRDPTLTEYSIRITASRDKATELGGNAWIATEHLGVASEDLVLTPLQALVAVESGQAPAASWPGVRSRPSSPGTEVAS